MGLTDVLPRSLFPARDHCIQRFHPAARIIFSWMLPDQCFIITTWQIGAAYATVKQYIAADQKTLFLAIKTQAARAMPWGQDNGQRIISTGYPALLLGT